MDRRFYDLDIQSDVSSGEDSVEELAERAERLGFDAIAVSDYAAEEDDVERLAREIENAETPLDVHLGAKLKPEDPGDLKDMLNRFREKVEVVVVHGGDAEVNRAAAADSRVDVLAHPERDRTDPGIDHAMAREAADNRVAVQINISRLLGTYGKVRAHVLSHMRRNVRLCQALGAPVIASSGAGTVHGLRAPRELAAFPRVLGMGVEESFDTVSKVPRKVVERAEKVTSEGFVSPGVEVVEDG